MGIVLGGGGGSRWAVAGVGGGVGGGEEINHLTLPFFAVFVCA